jgi:hypothetical protein
MPAIIKHSLSHFWFKLRNVAEEFIIALLFVPHRFCQCRDILCFFAFGATKLVFTLFCPYREWLFLFSINAIKKGSIYFNRLHFPPLLYLLSGTWVLLYKTELSMKNIIAENGGPATTMTTTLWSVFLIFSSTAKVSRAKLINCMLIKKMEGNKQKVDGV